MDTKKTGAFIATLRKEKGLTQQALSEQLYVTAKTVSRWETGSYAPPIDILAKLSDILGATADEIIAGERRTTNAELFSEKPAIKQSIFDLKEKVAFYRKKWLHEHILPCIILAVGIVIILTVTLLQHLYRASGIVLIGAVTAYLVIRNRLMSYIERNAYDGLRSDTEITE